MARNWCRLESLYDGTLDLAAIAEANDMMNLADENERRMQEWAERRF